MPANHISTGASHCGQKEGTRERLMHKFGNDIELLALGGAVARVVQIASSDDGATHGLTYCVLSDVALTQKILRLANTVSYRSSCGAPVTTVSRAIFILGFETVRITALAMLLVDSLSNSRQAVSVRKELLEALCASLVGRELARQSPYQGGEEASIAALFKNIGRLLIASHEHALYSEIEKLTEAGSHTHGQAAMLKMGCSFESLGDFVLQEWKIPGPIIHALSPVLPGIQKQSKNRQEWMRQVACFSAESAGLILHTSDPETSAAGQAALQRFGNALHLDQDRMGQVFTQVRQEMDHLIESLELTQMNNGMQGSEKEDATGLPGILRNAAMDTCIAPANERHPSGKPVNARNLLLAGVQDATQMLVSGRCKSNELIMLVLETLYTGMGFRFATVCLRDVGNNQFRARIAIGENQVVRQAGFVFSATSKRDIFHLAMENNVDLMISDASDEKIRDLLPSWHKSLMPDACSIIVLPLVLQKVQLGFFYADRVRAAPEGVPSDETTLIKTLMGQVLAALSSR